MKANAMPSRMTASKHKKMTHKHKFRRSTIEAAENGGYVVEHQPHNNGDMSIYGNEQKHAFSSAKDMHAHLQTVYPEGTARHEATESRAERANEQEDGEQA